MVVECGFGRLKVHFAILRKYISLSLSLYLQLTEKKKKKKKKCYYRISYKIATTYNAVLIEVN